MSDELMLKCLIAFILGYFLCKMMGNGFSVGAQRDDHIDSERILKLYTVDPSGIIRLKTS